MDNSNFDAVARAIAAGASRRQVLRLLAIGTMTNWLPGRARAVPARQECDGGLTFCEGSGVCSGLADDAFNCGACGNACASGVCDRGSCVEVGCAEGLADCTGSGVCTSLIDDPNNCGECGNACASGVCDGGVCTQPGCDEGLTYCESSGVCTGLRDDAYNCGECGNACASGVCEKGTCTEVGCAAGFTYCEAFGACYDLASDPNHCGACDVTCASGDSVAMACVDGACVAAGCVSPFVDCAGACIDLSGDPQNCGACGAICASETCTEGLCAPLTCEAGLTYCEEDDACYDLATEANHCGTCGTVCASGVCTSGACAEPTTTPATPAVPTPTPTPPTDDVTATQEAAPTGTERQRRDRASRTQGTGSASSSQNTAPSSAKPAKIKEPKVKQATITEAPESALAWPFDPQAGQWTIIHGYRAEDEGTNNAATPPADGGDFARFALAFGVCRVEDVDEVDGTCELGPTAGRSDAVADEPGWDIKATEGAFILSPVDGTVAWTSEESAPCQSVGLDIKGHPGYRVALFNVAGHPGRGETVKQGKRMGKVARSGCAGGDVLSMALYQPRAGAADDPEAGRKGVPFTGDWTIARCDYPDDKKTANQYRGELVPCKPEDEVSPKS